MNRILFIAMLCVLHSFYSKSQVSARFESPTETVVDAEVGKLSSHDITVIVPGQEKLVDRQIEVFILDSDLSVPMSDVFLPPDNAFKVSGEEQKWKLKISFIVRNENDRLIKIGLREKNNEGGEKIIEKTNSVKTIFIKPFTGEPLERKEGYELWLYTGTNFDFVEGLEVQKLFFKGTYFNNINNEENLNRWAHISFGKYQFVSSSDSSNNVEYTDVSTSIITADSMNRIYINGHYDYRWQIITSNTFFLMDYLFEVPSSVTKHSKILLGSGLYFGLKDVAREVEHNILSADSIITPYDLTKKYYADPKIKSVGYSEGSISLNCSIHQILSTDDIDVKSYIRFGASFSRNWNKNNLVNPVDISEPEPEESNPISPYLHFGIDCVVLNPGLSLGIEAFYWYRHQPLFNVSVSKVFNVKNIEAMFRNLKSSNLN